MPQVLAVIYWKYDSTSRYLKIFIIMVQASFITPYRHLYMTI